MKTTRQLMEDAFRRLQDAPPCKWCGKRWWLEKTSGVCYECRLTHGRIKTLDQDHVAGGVGWNLEKL